VLDTWKNEEYSPVAGRVGNSTKQVQLYDRQMGSTTFDDADPALAGLTSSQQMKRASGIVGCAMASDRI
jgi:hypothetical protein